MKKQIIVLTLVTAFCSITNIIYAQNFFVAIGSGYNFGSASLTGINSTSNGSSSTTYDKVDISFGKGINLDGKVGYMFNKHLGTELGFSYLIGGTSTLETKSTSYTETINFTSSMARFIPTLIITAGFEKLNPYAKLGLILGSGSYTEVAENISTFGGSTNTTKTTTKYDGGFAVGFYSGFGVMYKLNEKISILGELSINNLSYAPSKGEMTEYSENGVDKLATQTIYDKQIEFSESYTSKSGPNDTSVARKSLKQSLPFSSVGFNLGISYSF